MPTHGLRLDLELVILTASAVALSYFITGNIVSNVLFTVLLGSLFFLEGLHIDISRLKNFSRSDPFSLSFLSVFFLVPVFSLIFAYIFPRFEQLFLVLGISSVSIGSTMVWSNIAGGNGKLTESVSTGLLTVSIVLVPFLALAFTHLNLDVVMVVENLHIVAVPFLLGLILHNSSLGPIQDLRFHFSKVAFFLIVLLTLTQLQITLGEQGVDSLISYGSLAVILGFYVFFSFLLGYIPSKLYGISEKNSISVGFISSSRNVGIAFFLGSLISGEVVVLVGLYYMVRQVVGTGITDLFMHGELRLRERIGL